MRCFALNISSEMCEQRPSYSEFFNYGLSVSMNAYIPHVFFLNFHQSYGYKLVIFKYRTRAIISRGLYIFYPIFKDNFFVFKEVFSENSVLMYGWYSRAVSNQERVMMARVRYIIHIDSFSDIIASPQSVHCRSGLFKEALNFLAVQSRRGINYFI